jgi:putative addiction module component (TIGR02574 family)
MAEDLLVSKDRVLDAARRLSATDRIDLFIALRDELRRESSDAADQADELTEGEFSDEQLAELDRRMARHEANPDAAIPWEQIEPELDDPRRLSRRLGG